MRRWHTCLFAPGLDLDAGKLNFCAAGKAMPVDLVVAREGRRVKAHAQRIDAVSRYPPVASVMIKPWVPEEVQFVRAEFLAPAVDQRRQDLQAGDEAAVGGVAHGDLDMHVVGLFWLHPLQLSAADMMHALGLLDRVRDQVFA